MTRRAALTIEYGLLWLGLPAAAGAARLWIHLPILPLLWIVTAACLVSLLRDRSFHRRELWNIAALSDHWKPIALRFAVLGPMMFAAVWWLTPDMLLAFPKRNPGFWAVVMVAYPILSVYPQGIVWRSFLLHRYAALSDRPRVRWLAAAIAFGWLHVIFLNGQAPLLTLVGGYMFARTHQRSRSLVVSSIEHAMYGCCLFTAGWGWYFYHGSQQFVHATLGR